MSPSNPLMVIAENELRLLFRERTIYLLLGIFFVMAVLSTVIGYATDHTITNVYEAAVAELASLGAQAPAFPVNSTPLGIMTNMIIYIVLIGSLVAIVLGYFVGIHDKVYGTTKLLFTRPIQKSQIFLGKALTVAGIIFFISLISFVVSIVSLGVFGVLTGSAVIQVSIFYLVSVCYLLGFAFLALAFALIFKNTTSAMLYALFVWMIITFALPELGSALYPTSSLNPVLPPSTVIESPLLSLSHKIIYPFSVSEHYKALSGTVLGVHTGGVTAPISSVPIDVLVVLLWSAGATILSYVSFTRLKITNDSAYE